MTTHRTPLFKRWPVFKRWPAWTIWLVLFPVSVFAADLRTPLEVSAYQTLPNAAAVDAYLETLAKASPLVRSAVIGHSPLGRPLTVLYISTDPQFPKPTPAKGKKLTILLIGSQHGTEPSGGEALQIFARDLTTSDLRRFLDVMNVAIVPLSNPDGRDLDQRVNGSGVNLSTDFILQSQPETRALTGLLAELAPEVVLDVHESAILKTKSLAIQGYMTDFEAQFEGPTNPNVYPPLASFTQKNLLPRVLDAVNAKGTRAAHYIGEITDINQRIIHGGATLRNIRNYGAFRGMLTMLLENRKDPPGDYPTPLNIRNRVAKQLASITGFLDTVVHNREKIRAAVAEARRHLARQPGTARLAVAYHYAPRPGTPTISLPMTEIASGKTADRAFRYEPEVTTTLSAPLPAFYAVRRARDRIATVLARHGIRFSRLDAPRTVTARVLTIDKVRRRPSGAGKIGFLLEVKARETLRQVVLAPGDLWVDLSQPLGALVPLILNPCSPNQFYLAPENADLLIEGQEPPAVAVP